MRVRRTRENGQVVSDAMLVPLGFLFASALVMMWISSSSESVSDDDMSPGVVDLGMAAHEALQDMDGLQSLRLCAGALRAEANAQREQPNTQLPPASEYLSAAYMAEVGNIACGDSTTISTTNIVVAGRTVQISNQDVAPAYYSPHYQAG